MTKGFNCVLNHFVDKHLDIQKGIFERDCFTYQLYSCQISATDLDIYLTLTFLCNIVNSEFLNVWPLLWDDLDLIITLLKC